jgi:hypothetical protein
MRIKEHPTWKVIDSTKLIQYMQCPRSYFFRYVLGWDNIEPNIHLEFGSAWHLAMAHLLEHDYSASTVNEAYEIFLSHYRKFWSPLYDEGNAPKNPSNVLRGLHQYSLEYEDDLENFKVLATEIAGSILIRSDLPNLFFRMDTLIESQDGFASLEHKTGKGGSYWMNQWAQSVQMGTYQHVLHCMFPENADAVYINAFFPSNPPRIKKDGTPYSGDKDNSFLRFALRWSNRQMNDWYVTVSWWLEKIQEDMDKLEVESNTAFEHDVMEIFVKNTTSCGHYAGCPYSTICRAWANPLAEPCHIVQPGFVERFWDPRPPELGGEGEAAKKIITL